MSTPDNFDEELSASTTGLNLLDKVLIAQASSGLKKYCLGSDVANFVGGAVGVVNVPAATTILAITQALHAGKIVTLSNTAPIAITLPLATGTGNFYRFQVQVAATATASTISRHTTADIMQGFVTALTTASANVVGYGTTATANTISLNGTTLGGVVGDWYELVDIGTGIWMVDANTSPTGTTATPFSHV